MQVGYHSKARNVINTNIYGIGRIHDVTCEISVFKLSRNRSRALFVFSSNIGILDTNICGIERIRYAICEKNDFKFFAILRPCVFSIFLQNMHVGYHSKALNT